MIPQEFRFETLEDFLQAAADDLEAQVDARVRSGRLYAAGLQQFGEAGLKAASQTIHRKIHFLLSAIALAGIARLREGRPTLDIVHLNVLLGVKSEAEREMWADRAAEGDWSAAQLRREIAAARRIPEDRLPEVIVRKIGSSTERLKGLADEAEEAGVLPEAASAVESLAGYVRTKMNARGDGNE